MNLFLAQISGVATGILGGIGVMKLVEGKVLGGCILLEAAVVLEILTLWRIYWYPYYRA
jgi:hypothetical protein